MAGSSARVAGLTRTLFISRLKLRDGAGIVTVLSIVAIAAATAVALITVSGTWLLYHRVHHPFGLVKEALETDPSISMIVSFYLTLAALACAALTIPVLSVTSSAAIVIASMRERSLAVLRLLGMTRGQVFRIAAAETIIIAVVGVVVGGTIGAAVLPLFRGVPVQGTPIEIRELYMPVGMYVLTALGMLLICSVATMLGLARVSISPLGVARRSAPKALRIWRLALLGALVVLIILLPNLAEVSQRTSYRVAAVALVGAYIAMDVAFPYVVQQASKLIARSPSLTVSWAARQTAFNPKSITRRVSGITVLLFLAFWGGRIPFELMEVADGPVNDVLGGIYHDVRLGFILTLAFSAILAAVSTTMTQCNAELEGKDQVVALSRMGIRSSVGQRVSWLSVLGSFVGLGAIASLVGYALAVPFQSNLRLLEEPEFIFQSMTVIVALAVVCVSIVALGLLVTVPFRRRILHNAAHQRHAD